MLLKILMQEKNYANQVANSEHKHSENEHFSTYITVAAIFDFQMLREFGTFHHDGRRCLSSASNVVEISIIALRLTHFYSRHFTDDVTWINSQFHF